MSRPRATRLLYQLARLYGIQMAYYDMNHQRCPAPVASIVAALRSLGAPVAGPEDVSSAWRERRQALWRKPVEPVIVAWDGDATSVPVRLPEGLDKSPLTCHLKLEAGEEKSWQCSGADLPVVDSAEIEGTRYLLGQLSLPGKLPLGYHHLRLELGGNPTETLVIAAPTKAHVPTGDKANEQGWGAFLPLYALHTLESWGGGSFSDLEALARWLAETGGKVVATLPLLAAFLDEPFEPSPYLPVSRRLWNEFYLDIERIPELAACPSARARLEAPSFRDEIKTLRQAPLVDYRRQMALKRSVLEELCRSLFTGSSSRLDALHHFAGASPLVADYACFRAVGEQRSASWHEWPPPLRDGVLQDTDYNEENRRYHLYVQWLAHQQMEYVSRKITAAGLALYLDLPLGVHPGGYDVWREREAFAENAAAGSPPDDVFTRGQNWGFPPLHPEGIRAQGYRYVIACLRHHLQQARILRLDHVMSLHRLFCIPHGLAPGQGVYVRYRAEEFYAILALEAHRHQALIVGEDLGTVPPDVRPTMRRHGLQRMYVVNYELNSNRKRGLPPVFPQVVASLNTHDMPPFAAFWQGGDIKERERLGLLDAEAARAERTRLLRIKRALVSSLHQRGWLSESESDTSAIIRACLSFLADSRARLVLVNLEDIWGELAPQNIPTTRQEYPNWRRRARYPLEQFCRLPQVASTLRVVNELRQKRRYR